MSPDPTVSIVIPSYRDLHFLAKSLPLYLQHAAFRNDIEVLIVNTDPDEQLGAWVSQRFSKNLVHVIDTRPATGFGRAVNRGIRVSRGDLIFIANSDLLPADGYIEEMSAFFARHPRAGLAMGKILRYDTAADAPTDIIDNAGLVLSRSRRFLARGEGSRDIGQFDRVEQVFGVDGSAVFARREALQSIAIEGEYFDESFVMYKEDWDLSWRVRLMGWECWYVPSAVAFHARTVRGLGETPYLTAWKAFHRNERTKPDYARFHSLKNQWLMLLKNEDGINFLRDCAYIMSREFLVLTYNIAFSPKTLLAIRDFAKLVPATLAKRRRIKRSQILRPGEVRYWLRRSGLSADH